MPHVNGKTKKKLTRQLVTDYDPSDVFLAGNAYYNWRRRPPFHRLFHVPAMLADPRVQMTLAIMKGMITSLSRFYVDEGDAEEDSPSEVKKFVTRQISRFWRVAANRLLTAMEWGWYGSEVIYRINTDGCYCFADMNDFQQRHVYPVTMDGQFLGIELRHKAEPRYIGGQKAFWHTHWRHKNKWWGGSRLVGAFEPWLDKHDEGGALDVRRLYYYKHVFQGEVMRHPPGSHVDDQGNSTPYDRIARAMVEKARTGGIYVLPSQFDPTTGKPLWDIQDRMHSSAAGDVRDYCADLDREITEGIGMSQEIFQAAESGSGYSGRKIPETATRGMLTEVVFWMINDADAQIFRPLVRLNFDMEPDYEIIPFGLIADKEDNDVHAVQDPGRKEVPKEALQLAIDNPTVIAV